MEYPHILRTLRKMAQLKPDELAKKTEISRSWVYAIEKGEGASPSIQIVKKWVNACKPKDDLTEWHRLVLMLLIDDENGSAHEEAEIESLEMSNKSGHEDIQSKKPWSTFLVPKRFRKTP